MFYTACCMLVFIIQSQSITSFYKSNLLSYQFALPLIRSTNLFYFLWVGNLQIALKGGTLGWLCKLFGKFWTERSSSDLTMCLQKGWAILYLSNHRLNSAALSFPTIISSERSGFVSSFSLPLK